MELNTWYETEGVIFLQQVQRVTPELPMNDEWNCQDEGIYYLF